MQTDGRKGHFLILNEFQYISINFNKFENIIFYHFHQFNPLMGIFLKKGLLRITFLFMLANFVKFWSTIPRLP